MLLCTRAVSRLRKEFNDDDNWTDERFCIVHAWLLLDIMMDGSYTVQCNNNNDYNKSTWYGQYGI